MRCIYDRYRSRRSKIEICPRLRVRAGASAVAARGAVRVTSADAAFCADFCEAAIQLSEDASVRAVLITARGRFFSVGGDIGMFAKNLDTLPDKIREWTTESSSAIQRSPRGPRASALR